MNIQSLASVAIQTVNPDISAIYRKSLGFTVGHGYKQTPTYAADVGVKVNFQALDGKDLRQLDGLNIQGTIKTAIVNFKLNAASYPEQTGGDLLIINSQTWLVVKILEGWGNWTKAAIVLQADDN